MPEGLLDDSGIGFSDHSGGKGVSEVKIRQFLKFLKLRQFVCLSLWLITVFRFYALGCA